MVMRLIRNEEEYETALAEIDALWDAEAGTPEADRLDVLVLLVEAYEAEHYPIWARSHRTDSPCHGRPWLNPA